MLSRRFFISLGVIFALVMSFGSIPAQASANDDVEGAKQFIHKLTTVDIEPLTNPDLPKAERIKIFREIFSEKFAKKSIGKWILGRNWRKATDAEREEYLKLFEDLLVVSYVDRFMEYNKDNMNIEKAVLDPKGNSYTVFSSFKAPKATDTVQVGWRLGKNKDRFYVLDIVVQGSSLSNTMRSEFASVISQKGGVPGLLETLREKTAALKAEVK